MPLAQAFADSLRGTAAAIDLQWGWGWVRKLEAETWASFEPPRIQLRVRILELVQPSGPILGFSGVVESDRPEFTGLHVLAYTHTTETVTADDVVPLALGLSPQVPACVPDESKIVGYTMIPEGSPAYLGFGILVPPDLATPVRP